jgi:hypothetical protein
MENKKYPCPRCPTGFSRRYHLDKHLLTCPGIDSSISVTAPKELSTTTTTTIRTTTKTTTTTPVIPNTVANSANSAVSTVATVTGATATPSSATTPSVPVAPHNYVIPPNLSDLLIQILKAQPKEVNVSTLEVPTSNETSNTTSNTTSNVANVTSVTNSADILNSSSTSNPHNPATTIQNGNNSQTFSVDVNKVNVIALSKGNYYHPIVRQFGNDVEKALMYLKNVGVANDFIEADFRLVKRIIFDGKRKSEFPIRVKDLKRLKMEYLEMNGEWTLDLHGETIGKRLSDNVINTLLTCNTQFSKRVMNEQDEEKKESLLDLYQINKTQAHILKLSERKTQLRLSKRVAEFISYCNEFHSEMGYVPTRNVYPDNLGQNMDPNHQDN